MGAATAVGLGPGSIFTPVMVLLDMHPAVASATGMYLTMFTTGAATINLFIFQALNVKYTLLLCLFTLLGSVPGIYLQQKIVEVAGGRTQFTVILLIALMILIVATVT